MFPASNYQDANQAYPSNINRPIYESDFSIFAANDSQLDFKFNLAEVYRINYFTGSTLDSFYFSSSDVHLKDVLQSFSKAAQYFLYFKSARNNKKNDITHIVICCRYGLLVVQLAEIVDMSLVEFLQSNNLLYFVNRKLPRNAIFRQLNIDLLSSINNNNNSNNGVSNRMVLQPQYRNEIEKFTKNLLNAAVYRTIYQIETSLETTSSFGAFFRLVLEVVVTQYIFDKVTLPNDIYANFTHSKTSSIINPYINPSLNPNLNTNFNHNINPSSIPNINSGFNPNLNANFNPNINPSSIPNIIPSSNPNLSANFNPNPNPNLNANFNPNINPNSNPNLNANFNPSYNPNLNANFNPNIINSGSNPYLNADFNSIINPSQNIYNNFGSSSVRITSGIGASDNEQKKYSQTELNITPEKFTYNDEEGDINDFEKQVFFNGPNNNNPNNFYSNSNSNTSNNKLYSPNINPITNCSSNAHNLIHNVDNQFNYQSNGYNNSDIQNNNEMNSNYNNPNNSMNYSISNCNNNRFNINNNGYNINKNGFNINNNGNNMSNNGNNMNNNGYNINNSINCNSNLHSVNNDSSSHQPAQASYQFPQPLQAQPNVSGGGSMNVAAADHRSPGNDSDEKKRRNKTHNYNSGSLDKNCNNVGIENIAISNKDLTSFQPQIDMFISPSANGVGRSMSANPGVKKEINSTSASPYYFPKKKKEFINRSIPSDSGIFLKKFGYFHFSEVNIEPQENQRFEIAPSPFETNVVNPDEIDDDDDNEEDNNYFRFLNQSIDKKHEIIQQALPKLVDIQQNEKKYEVDNTFWGKLRDLNNVMKKRNLACFDDGKYACNICNITFSSVADLLNHSWIKHLDQIEEETI